MIFMQHIVQEDSHTLWSKQVGVTFIYEVMQ